MRDVLRMGLVLLAVTALQAQVYITIPKKVVLPNGSMPTASSMPTVSSNPILTAIDARSVTGAPFSALAVTESVQTLADGNRILHTNKVKLFRDSQGRERRESDGQTFTVLGQQMAAASIVIFDPTANASYSFEAQGLTATKRLAPRGFVLGGLTRELQGAVSGPDPGVLGVKEKLPAAVIEGLNVEGTRSTATISAGKIGNERDIVVVDEVWYSPDLRINLLMKHSDPRSGETVYRLTGISRGEADPALFKVPAGYTLKEEPFRITPR